MRRFIIVSLCLLSLAVSCLALARSINARAPDTQRACPELAEGTKDGVPVRLEAVPQQRAAMDALRACNPSWQVVPSANVGSLDNFLTAVAALSPTDVWAVGYYTGTGRYLSLTEHWDGAQWNVVSSPNPGAYNNILRGVTIVASNDAWAVGDYNNSYDHPTRHLLTMHWDGAQWNVVPNPDPGGNYDNSINGVKAFASDDMWAVGFYRYTDYHDLRMFWNGVQWTVSYSPTVPFGNSASVDGLSAADVWAVGRNGLVFPNQPLLEHWDGANWQVASGPALPDNSWMNGVGVISADNTWAVGTYAPNNVRHSLVEHWDGSIWGLITSPDVGELKSITTISPSDAWAVAAGTFLHWDGSAWTASSDPAGGSLTAIDALSSTDIWAVGTQQVGGASRTLVEHYTTGCSTPAPTYTSTPPATAITATTATATATATATTAPSATATSELPSSTPSPSPTTPLATTTARPTGTRPSLATATSALTATPTSCSIAFSDVPTGSTFYPFVQCLACLGVVQGYPDGTYRPNNPVTRGQAAKIIANSAGYHDRIPPSQQTFNDVAPGSTFWLYVERVALHGAISGYPCGSPGEPCPGTYFRPQNTLTRGQAAKVVSITAGYNDVIPPSQQTFNDVPPGSTFWLYVERIALHGVVSGYADGTFRPQNPLTRGQLAKIASNAFFPACER